MNIPSLFAKACVYAAPLVQFAVADVQRIAVLLGNDQGLEDERPLRYASRDATEMSAALRRAGTFDEDRIYLLVNSPLEKINKTLDEVKGRVRELRKAGTESLVLIYYSGHGSAEGLHVQGRNFARKDLTQYLDELESNLKILILDACESGDFLRQKGGRLVEAPEVARIDKLESKGTILISASSRGEMAQESEDYRGAVFTHHFLNGLRGLADYDGDKSIRLMEAFDYARVSTRREEILGSSPQQNPEFDFDLTGESDPVMAKLAPQQSQLVLHKMPAGPVEIYNGNTLQLETKVWLTGQDSVRFTLPSGKYILAYGEKDASRILEVDMTWQRQAAVEPSIFLKKPKSLLYGKGGGRALDLHFNGTQIASRRIAPFGSVRMDEAGYVYRNYATKQILGLSMARASLSDSANGLANRMQIYGIGYTLETPVLRGMRGQVLAGGQVSFHHVFQHLRDTRFTEAPQGPDGNPLPLAWDEEANLYRAALPLEGEIYFPWRMWLSASLAPAVTFYRDAHGSGWHFDPAVEPAVALGHQF